MKTSTALVVMMEKKNLSINDLAKIAGVARQTAGLWVSGKAQPSINKLNKVCEKLDIKFSELSKWGEL